MILQRLLIAFAIICFVCLQNAEAQRWQQSIRYKMEIDMDVTTHQFKGHQIVQYNNNSPDTLRQMFYHLYFNAFQPGSMMDVRSRTISDPSPKIGDRIFHLEKNEYGFQHIKSFKINGKDQKFHIEDTVMEIMLDEPILPHSFVIMEMDFIAQVPKQIRRSGRNNSEGIEYSMAQWYPKVAEYDEQGWHAHPYVTREFYGVWGDFDVKIKIDSDYVLGGSGILQNPEKIGYGYSDKEPRKRPKKMVWHFIAENVHDFFWAADPDYDHYTHMTKSGTLLHFLYQPGEATTENWRNLAKVMDRAEVYMNERFGEYPYPVYYFIQGGDGGMEYAMGTLITGERTFSSLVGVSIHEWFHSWYQMVLGNNESLYAWMDEGFTSYATAETMNYLRREKLIPGEAVDLPHKNTATGFAGYSAAGYDEAMITHADHFQTNRASSIAAYTKGELFLLQLEYILGKETFNRAFKRYFNEWKFKHPNPNDVIRVFEKESNIELDWYREYWVNTTWQINYSIDSLSGKKVHLSKKGVMPMPLDILITKKDGTRIMYNIPLAIMRGHKTVSDVKVDEFYIAKDWRWTNPDYDLKLNFSVDEIENIQIDPLFKMVDIDRENNTWPKQNLEINP